MPEEKSQKLPVFLFYGEDTYSSSQKVNFWRKEFTKKYGEESSVEIFDNKSLDIGQFDTNIEAMPFLSEKRLIIIKDYLSTAKADDQKKVAETLEKTPDFCVIVFHENGPIEKSTPILQKIKKIGKVEEFENLPPAKLAQWIMDKAKKEDIKIRFEIANYLGLHCGTELWRVSSELEKLKVYADQKEITKSMIDELVTPSITASIFKLTDSIATKDTKESLKTFALLKESGEELTRIFFMIARHFRILIQVSDMLSKKENSISITKRLKQHPFVIQKTSSQSRNFTLNRLTEIYENLLEIDKNFKTGVIKTYQRDDREYELAIEKLIINCCK